MPTMDQTRLARDRAHPRLMALWWALCPLKSVTRFMQTGAHPDDEMSGMLAALALRDGLTLSYACSTRGEGGQNDIGTEAGADLGALRTREMEAACDLMGMRLYWHSTDPNDTITDFGFSKSGEETLERWGEARVMARFVEIVRTERPDILCPTFLDVPGQHGHHRAMTQAAHAVIAAAADPSHPCGLEPWRVKKLYLPAWSGAGQAYDDDVPPPKATVVVPGVEGEPMSGWSWNRIGQHARAMHRTQGMGRWVPAGPGHDWPLHLAYSDVAGLDHTLWSGLPYRLADLARLPGADPIAANLARADAAIDKAIAAFPDFAAVAEAAALALREVQTVQAACPAALTVDIEHRLTDKARQLGHVLRLALGVEARVSTSQTYITAGASVGLVQECHAGSADAVEMALALPQGWSEEGDALQIDTDAAPVDAYRAMYDPLHPPKPHIALTMRAHGAVASVALPFESEPVVLPPRRATLSPQSVFVNAAKASRRFEVQVSDLAPAGADLTVDVPEGWRAEPEAAGFRLVLPQSVEPGLYTLGLRVAGHPVESVREIAHEHIAATARITPATARVRVADIAVPDTRVGYIGAGNDDVAHWVAAMGVDLHDLSHADLTQTDILAGFDSLVIGIFAMRFREGLVAAMPAIHRWVAAGGTLLTLYHRPWDNWDPQTVPPKPLEIGQPSLRWRVTDETAPVRILADHPILNAPNKIGPSDWDGWVKERGLYFAKAWDRAYTPLVEMADRDEDSHQGALLVADIGAGCHVHTGLILHHQMANLVPGAFRLMANFIAKRV
ncbi:MAG: PIG-L family deacetylase [Pseudomonadota bacterium]